MVEQSAELFEVMRDEVRQALDADVEVRQQALERARSDRKAAEQDAEWHAALADLEEKVKSAGVVHAQAVQTRAEAQPRYDELTAVESTQPLRTMVNRCDPLGDPERAAALDVALAECERRMGEAGKRAAAKTEEVRNAERGFDEAKCEVAAATVARDVEVHRAAKDDARHSLAPAFPGSDRWRENLDRDPHAFLQGCRRRVDECRVWVSDRNKADLRVSAASTRIESGAAGLAVLQAEAVLERDQALARHGIDGVEARRRLDRDEAWILLERTELRALDQAVSDAETRFGERRELRDHHGATHAPALSADEAARQVNALAASITELERQVMAVTAEQMSDDNARVKRDELGARMTELREQARVWEDLSDLIGSADGKKMQVFAQSLTLETLIHYANEHIADLSRRYRLMRAPSKKEVLAIQVVDQDMGDEIRSVDSLSGGESFLVSLAVTQGARAADESPLGRIMRGVGRLPVSPRGAPAAVRAAAMADHARSGEGASPNQEGMNAMGALRSFSMPLDDRYAPAITEWTGVHGGYTDISDDAVYTHGAGEWAAEHAPYTETDGVDLSSEASEMLDANDDVPGWQQMWAATHPDALEAGAAVLGSDPALVAAELGQHNDLDDAFEDDPLDDVDAPGEFNISGTGSASLTIERGAAPPGHSVPPSTTSIIVRVPGTDIHQYVVFPDINPTLDITIPELPCGEQDVVVEAFSGTTLVGRGEFVVNVAPNPGNVPPPRDAAATSDAAAAAKRDGAMSAASAGPPPIVLPPPTVVADVDQNVPPPQDRGPEVDALLSPLDGEPARFAPSVLPDRPLTASNPSRPGPSNAVEASPRSEAPRKPVRVPAPSPGVVAGTAAFASTRPAHLDPAQESYSPGQVMAAALASSARIVGAATAASSAVTAAEWVGVEVGVPMVLAGAIEIFSGFHRRDYDGVWRGSMKSQAGGLIFAGSLVASPPLTALGAVLARAYEAGT